MQHINFLDVSDLSEGYALVPLRGGQKNTVHGLTLLVNNAVFPYFLEQCLVSPNQNVISHVAPRFAVGFTAFTDCQGAARQGFGFNQGIRLGRTICGDWTSYAQIHVLFQQARRIPGLGWPGYAFVLNMNWLLDSLQAMEYPEWSGEGARQSFAIYTGFSDGFIDAAFPVTATVSRTCAQIFDGIMPKSFERANDAIADTLNWFHGPRNHNLMSVRAGKKGTLNIHQEPYSLGANPNDVELGTGYSMYSDNINDPVGQIVLLAGIAGVWEELRNCQATPI